MLSRGNFNLSNTGKVLKNFYDFTRIKGRYGEKEKKKFANTKKKQGQSQKRKITSNEMSRK